MLVFGKRVDQLRGSRLLPTGECSRDAVAREVELADI